MRQVHIFILGAVLCMGAVAWGECPIQGDGKNENEVELNLLKNRPLGPDKINPAITIEAMLSRGDDTNRFSQDQGAEITGYVVGVVPGGIESCNCHSADPKNRDTHIYVATDAKHANPSQCIVVEVTPRMRALHPEWETVALRKSIKNHIVKFTGWMLFDSEHKQNAINTEPSNTHCWRATAWEIHPVSNVEIVK